MLLFGSRLIGTPILGLQTGAKLAKTAVALIDPSNLKIVAYIAEGPSLVDHPSLIRIADIRELSDIGMIIDSSDEFIGVDDVIKIHDLYKLGFSLIGMSVIDETKQKLGKIVDFSVDSPSFVIQQLVVRRGFLKSLTNTELLIHRSQIVEINNSNIIVQTTAKRVEPTTQTERRAFVNPFRSTSVQSKSLDL